jgi:hypothetical protein
VFQAKQGLGDYLNQLARATQVQRLLERYIALAPGVNVIKLLPSSLKLLYANIRFESEPRYPASIWVGQTL